MLAKVIKWLVGLIALAWAVLTFMASNSPQEVADRVSGWAGLPIVRSAPTWLSDFFASPWTLAITFLAVGAAGGWAVRDRLIGYRVHLRGFIPTISPVPQPVEEPVTAPDPEEVARKKQVDKLVYDARQLTALLLRPGDCAELEVQSLIDKLGQQHEVWHDKGRFQEREKFLEATREALDARRQQADPITFVAGDFRPEQRRSFEGKLRQRLKSLEEYLDGSRRLLQLRGSDIEFEMSVGSPT